MTTTTNANANAKPTIAASYSTVSWHVLADSLPPKDTTVLLMNDAESRYVLAKLVGDGIWSLLAPTGNDHLTCYHAQLLNVYDFYMVVPPISPLAVPQD